MVVSWPRHIEIYKMHSFWIELCVFSIPSKERKWVCRCSIFGSSFNGLIDWVEWLETFFARQTMWRKDKSNECWATRKYHFYNQILYKCWWERSNCMPFGCTIVTSWHWSRIILSQCLISCLLKFSHKTFVKHLCASFWVKWIVVIMLFWPIFFCFSFVLKNQKVRHHIRRIWEHCLTLW